jgi:ribonuclease HII
MNEARPLPNLRDLEDEIARSAAIAHLPERGVKPAPDIGKLSAEAVLKQYDQTAKDVEELGTTVKEWIAKLEAILKDCHEDLDLISKAAQHVRTKGDAIYAVIDQATQVSKMIRDTCADFTTKVS